jgi:D-glycerate 3-kinase
MPEIIDDKSQFCIPFLLGRLHLASHADNPNPPPFFLGINGVQGAGKTVLVSKTFLLSSI